MEVGGTEILPCFQKLIDMTDSVGSEMFQWTRGDQCMLGQKDADSGLGAQTVHESEGH